MRVDDYDDDDDDDGDDDADADDDGYDDYIKGGGACRGGAHINGKGKS